MLKVWMNFKGESLVSSGSRPSLALFAVLFLLLGSGCATNTVVEDSRDVSTEQVSITQTGLRVETVQVEPDDASLVVDLRREYQKEIREVTDVSYRKEFKIESVSHLWWTHSDWGLRLIFLPLNFVYVAADAAAFVLSAPITLIERPFIDADDRQFVRTFKEDSQERLSVSDSLKAKLPGTGWVVTDSGEQAHIRVLSGEIVRAGIEQSLVSGNQSVMAIFVEEAPERSSHNVRMLLDLSLEEQVALLLNPFSDDLEERNTRIDELLGKLAPEAADARVALQHAQDATRQQLEALAREEAARRRLARERTRIVNIGHRLSELDEKLKPSRGQLKPDKATLDLLEAQAGLLVERAEIISSWDQRSPANTPSPDQDLAQAGEAYRRASAMAADLDDIDAMIRFLELEEALSH